MVAPLVGLQAKIVKAAAQVDQVGLLQARAQALDQAQVSHHSLRLKRRLKMKQRL